MTSFLAQVASVVFPSPVGQGYMKVRSPLHDDRFRCDSLSAQLEQLKFTSPITGIEVAITKTTTNVLKHIFEPPNKLFS